MSSIALPHDDTPSTLRAHKTTDHKPRTTDTTQDPLARRNARGHSTGPRSPEGKQRAAQNARKHSLSATTPPRDLLNDLTYQTTRDEYREEFRPITPAQVTLVDQLTWVSWRLDQIPKLEHEILTATTHLNTQDSAPSTPLSPESAHLLEDKPTPLTRLWDHHRRLLCRYQSLIRQIHQLQKHRKQQQADDSQLESDLERSRRRARDDAALTEELTRIHAANQKREQGERLARQRATLPLPPSPGTPGEGRGEGSPRNVKARDTAQSTQQSLAVSRTNTPPLAQPQPTPSNTPLAPAQNELPPSPSPQPQKNVEMPPASDTMRLKSPSPGSQTQK